MLFEVQPQQSKLPVFLPKNTNRMVYGRPANPSYVMGVVNSLCTLPKFCPTSYNRVQGNDAHNHSLA
jgi:hypothetical protein